MLTTLMCDSSTCTSHAGQSSLCHKLNNVCISLSRSTLRKMRYLPIPHLLQGSLSETWPRLDMHNSRATNRPTSRLRDKNPSIGVRWEDPRRNDAPGTTKARGGANAAPGHLRPGGISPPTRRCRRLTRRTRTKPRPRSIAPTANGASVRAADSCRVAISRALFGGPRGRSSFPRLAAHPRRTG